MAYQNVGTPVFYMDELSWRRANGIHMSVTQDSTNWNVVSGEMNNLFGLNPSNGVEIAIDGQHGNDTIYFQSDDFNFPVNQTYHTSILGHNFASFSGWYQWDAYTGTPDNNTYNVASGGLLVNAGTNYQINPAYDGFTMVKYSTRDTNVWRIQINPIGATSYLNNDIEGGYSYTSGVNLKLGSVVVGGVYEMPHSPDLNLKLSYEYDGVKTVQTKGGSTLSNASYTKPADWGSAGAWQLGGASNLRSGRRVWDLSFSYLSDSDVFPVNASTSYAATIGSEVGYPEGSIGQSAGGATPEDSSDDLYGFTSNILDGNDFFSQVWNKTMGGHLPFIFQPDGANNNPDQFAIARFDMKSLTYDQVANNVYNVKLKIRECW